jgi:hypothetical protein
MIVALPAVLASKMPRPPLFVMFALPAVLVSWNVSESSLVMVAVPAVLVPRNTVVAAPPPLLTMVAFPAVLVLLKVRRAVLVIAALPAVLAFWKLRKKLLVMLALPAVLVSRKFIVPKGLLVILALLAVLVVEGQETRIGDDSSPGRSRVEKAQGPAIGNVSVTGRAVAEEYREAVSVVGDGRITGRALPEKLHDTGVAGVCWISVVDDGGIAGCASIEENQVHGTGGPEIVDDEGVASGAAIVEDQAKEVVESRHVRGIIDNAYANDVEGHIVGDGERVGRRSGVELHRVDRCARRVVA